MFAKNEIIKNKLQNNWNDIVYKRGYLAIIEGKLKRSMERLKITLMKVRHKWFILLIMVKVNWRLQVIKY